MNIPAVAAVWFLPFVLPICFYVAYTDLRSMLIKNHAVVALFTVFAVLGFFLLPPWSTEWASWKSAYFTLTLPSYLWQLIHVGVVLFFGILLNAAGVLGAGDAKFIAAASAFIWPGDYMAAFFLLMITTMAAYVTHRLVRRTPLRAIAPEWESWNRDRHFPLGFPLGGALAIYLLLGTVYGS